jgi:hypothetical protein
MNTCGVAARVARQTNPSMENNKAYLQRIHWVFLVALPAALLFAFSDYWLVKLISRESRYYFMGLNMIPGTFFYIALGVCTQKWKPIGIAFIVYALLHTLDYVLYEKDRFDIIQRIILFFLSPLPLVTFLAVQYGWRKRLIGVYFLATILSNILFSGFYSMQGLGDNVRGFITISSKTESIVTIFTSMASLVCAVIFMCELMNYIKGKTIGSKSRLINLGNDYNQLQSGLGFWALKMLIWVTLVSCAQHITNHVLYFSRSSSIDSNIQRYFLFIGIITVLSNVCTTLLLGWYLRKFMIEYIITYNNHSKFLYWFSLLPVVGIFAFIIAHFDNSKQAKHSEKLASMAQFAASSTASVTTIFFILLSFRLLFRMISGGEPYFIISLVISVLLFVWMMNDRVGFYVNMTLNLLLLAAGMVIVFATEIGGGGGIAVLFGIVLLNVIHLVLLYPVYHFHDFEYIPAEDPDAATTKEFHLFDTP